MHSYPRAVSAFLGALSLLAPAATAISCLDGAGNPIDHWAAMKPDGNMSSAYSGRDYLYFSPSNPSQWESLPQHPPALGANDTGAIFQTASQIPYMNPSPDPSSLPPGYIVYNDQWCQCPEGRECTTKVLPNGDVCPTFDPIFLEENPDEMGCHCNSIDSPESRSKGYWTPADASGSVYGHAKGFLVFDERGGIWVTHSVPGWPYSAKVWEAAGGWVWPKTRFAQSFLCVSLDPAGVEAVAAGLTRSYVLPQEHSHSVPERLRSAYPAAAAMDVELGAPYPRAGGGAGQIGGSTRGGLKMAVFSKEGDSASSVDLWDDVVQPGLGLHLSVETWCRGPNRGAGFTLGECLGEPRACGEGGCICHCEGQEEEEAVYACQKTTAGVSQIVGVDYGRGGAESINSHAKWALGDDGKTVCFGDINRQATQRGRGGGAACVQSEELFGDMRGLVREVVA